MYKEITTDYDAIADEWDRSRKNPWGEFEFARGWLANKKVLSILDAGCGNGRLLNWLKGNKFSGNYLGVDNSAKLIEKAQKNFPSAKFQQADLLKFKPPKEFDLIFCVAVLHHLASPAERLKVLKNFQTSLKQKGRLFLTVWNLWQPRYLRYALKSFFNASPRDCRIPFGNKIERFVHAFTANELVSLFEQAGFEEVEVFPANQEKRSGIFSARNLVVLAKK